MYQFTSSGGSYTIPVAGRYKIRMAASGTMTGIVYYNKGVQLTVSYPSGWGSAGRGIVLLAGGSPALAAGGAGWCSSGNAVAQCAGGGGYYGGGAYNGGASNNRDGAGWDGSQKNYSKSGIGTGLFRNRGTTCGGYGGSGYCASGYSCSGGYGDSTGYIYPIVTYCGPSSSSSCP